MALIKHTDPNVLEPGPPVTLLVNAGLNVVRLWVLCGCCYDIQALTVTPL